MIFCCRFIRFWFVVLFGYCWFNLNLLFVCCLMCVALFCFSVCLVVVYCYGYYAVCFVRCLCYSLVLIVGVWFWCFVLIVLLLLLGLVISSFELWVVYCSFLFVLVFVRLNLFVYFVFVWMLLSLACGYCCLFDLVCSC